MEYIFEDIESIEQLEDFDNENVFDVEVDDDSHTFIGNDILVHNSVYTTYGNFFRCWTPETYKSIETDKQKTDWILNFNKKFLDKQNTEWCKEIYNPRHGNNIHEFELETISKSLIGLKKKKYLKGYTHVKGKYYDPPKVAGTGIEIIKSTTPKLCRTILTDLMKSLMFEYTEENKSEYLIYFNDKLRNYRKQFFEAPYEDISQSVGVGDYNKFVIEDENDLIFEKGAPVSVKSVARFNYLAHKNNEDDKKFFSGKIKYYNTRISGKGKKAVIDYFGYPAGELPTWRPEMDKTTQWRKTIIDPINRFLEVMNIPLANAENSVELNLFDF